MSKYVFVHEDNEEEDALGDPLPVMRITLEVDGDSNIHDLFEQFERFLKACGFTEKCIHDGLKEAL